MGTSILRLDTRYQLKDGTYPVQIVVGHGTNIYLPTEIYLLPEHWDTRLRKCIGGKGYARINDALDTMLLNVKMRILELRQRGIWHELTYAQKREMLLHTELDKPTAGRLTLAAALKSIIDGRSERTQNINENTRKRIQLYAGDPDCIFMDTINRAWIEDFERSLGKMSHNTRTTYLSVLRRAFNWAYTHDYIQRNPFKGYSIKMEETPMRVLPVARFREFIFTDFPRRYNEYRDFFLLTFCLIGINTVDLADCTKDSIKNGRLEYRRHKTGKLYSIKIEPEAMTIIEKYRGRKHLLRWFDKYDSYRVWQGTCNNALSRMKINGKVIQKGLSIYWARYSWATYAAELDVTKDTISEALGHSYGANITGVYIQFKHEKIDAANRKVIDYVLKGKTD